MAGASLTHLAPLAYGIVAVASGIMAYLTWRSYQATDNQRLLFVFFAFVTFLIKSVLVAANEVSADHPVDHHVMLVFAGAFDVLVVLLLFVPFLGKPRRR